jgi:pimeloyl-ACP methyl ester carboxylesterase
MRLAYEVHGQGEPILLLAGTAMGKEAWLGGLAPALADAGYQVVLMDNRGFGGSDAPPAPYAIADLAADTAGLIEHLGIGPCRLVGYSLGGFVAEFLAAERPDLLRAAALLACAGPATAYARLREETELEFIHQGIDLPHRKQIFDFLATSFTSAKLQDDMFVQRIIDRMLSSPLWGNPGRHGQLTAADEWHAQYADTHAARWAKISVPVLAVAFEHDCNYPPADARQLTQGVSGAELVVIPESLHGGVFTHAAEVAKALLTFFATN